MKPPVIPFDRIFMGNLNEQIMVFRKFSENMEKRNNMKQISNPRDPCDPLLYSLWDK